MEQLQETRLEHEEGTESVEACLTRNWSKRVVGPGGDKPHEKIHQPLSDRTAGTAGSQKPSKRTTSL